MVLRVVAVTVVLGAVVAAVYVAVHRFDGGPLAADAPYLDFAPLEVGETRTFLKARLLNTGSREVRVEKIAPQRTLDGSLVEVWVPKPGVRRPLDQNPFPPAALRPAAGARVGGRKGSTFSRRPLLITVTPARRGCAGFGGLVIEYRSGLRRYRRVMKLAFGGHAGERARCYDLIARLADRSG